MGDVEGNKEESNCSEDEVTPLVGRSNESTDKTSDDHHFVKDEGVNNGRPWHASCQEQVQQKKLRMLLAIANTRRTRDLLV